MRKFIAFGPAFVVLLATLVTLVAAPAAVRFIGYANTDNQVTLAQHALDGDNILKQIDRAVRSIADAVEPSVVHVGVDETITDQWGRNFKAATTGSGWVYDKLGHIVTNAHVVRNAQHISVQFSDGRAAEATVVGQDPSTDIAVLQVSTTEGLFPILRASGLELHQGDRVYAFGSPFGFKFSMSEGIISGLGRDPQRILASADGFSGSTDAYTNFIQTDAAVNPGNSGGPLVNVEGKLVGMNVAIATAPTRGGEGQNSGISFAIPLSTLDRIVEQIVSGGVVTRGFMGIGRPSDDETNALLLNQVGYHGRGVIINRVERNSPADKAGLKVDDVIVKIDNAPIPSVPVLRSAIANNSPGDKVTVEVWRKGETKKFSVELGRLISDSDKSEAANAAGRFGILDVADTRNGEVFLTRVRVNSAAYSAGMRPNQRVVKIGSTEIKGLEDFFTALAANDLHQGHDVNMVLESRDGTRLDVKIAGK